MANAIAAGAVSLQQFIDSGELEELADVIPHIDDNDDFDEYDDSDDNMDLETMSDIELPAPLPSSIFARRAAQQQQQRQQQQQQQQHQQHQQHHHPPHQRKSRFSDREDARADSEINASINSHDTSGVR